MKYSDIRHLALAGGLLASFGVASDACAAAVLDQAYEPTSGTRPTASVGGGSIRAQTFTVGLEGMLDSIAVYVSRVWRPAASTDTDPVKLELVKGVTTYGTSPVVATSTILFADVPAVSAQFVSADFSSANLALSAGDVFTIWMSSTADELNHVTWFGNIADGYSRGRGYVDGVPTGNPLLDFHFRTYVRSAPEPATLALFGLGLAGLGAVRRKKLAA